MVHRRLRREPDDLAAAVGGRRANQCSSEGWQCAWGRCGRRRSSRYRWRRLRWPGSPAIAAELPRQRALDWLFSGVNQMNGEVVE